MLYKNMPLLQILLNLPFLILGFGTKHGILCHEKVRTGICRGNQEWIFPVQERKKVPFFLETSAKLRKDPVAIMDQCDPEIWIGEEIRERKFC